MSTAPEDVRFCTQCGGPLTTRDVRRVPRRWCPACDHIHYADPKVAVGVAVFRDDRLLLVRRTMNPGRGRWSLPGGYLDIGEDPVVAAAREAEEEAGVRVDVRHVLDVFANPPQDGGAVFVLYAAAWVAGEPTAGDDADAADFFARADLPPLAFRSTERAVANWARWQTGSP
jgi:ADP-ribose pyrophosphatase YjhB (NUDIX family)